MTTIRLIKKTELAEAFEVLKACFLNVKPKPELCGIVFVAEVDGKIVGTVALAVTKAFSYIDDLAVLPDYRNQGIATQLVAAAMRIAEQNSDESYAICVSQWSSKIFKKLGFKKEDHGRYTKKTLAI